MLSKNLQRVEKRENRYTKNLSRCGEMVDTRDLKSLAPYRACWFDSSRRHHPSFFRRFPFSFACSHLKRSIKTTYAARCSAFDAKSLC